MSDAADREQRMSVRIYPSHEAQARDDAAFWASVPEAERILQVWKLSEEQWRQRGELPVERGLSRSITRIIRP